MGVHIGATCLTRLDDPFAAVMRPCIKWLWPHVVVGSSRCEESDDDVSLLPIPSYYARVSWVCSAHLHQIIDFFGARRTWRVQMQSCSSVALCFFKLCLLSSSFCLEICVLLFVLGVNSFLFHFLPMDTGKQTDDCFFVMRPQSFSMECSSIRLKYSIAAKIRKPAL